MSNEQNITFEGKNAGEAKQFLSFILGAAVEMGGNIPLFPAA